MSRGIPIVRCDKIFPPRSGLKTSSDAGVVGLRIQVPIAFTALTSYLSAFAVDEGT